MDYFTQDYQEHQNEIHEKLIAIMGDRLNAHVKNLRAIDWNVTPTRTPGGANGYMEVLVRETVTLHKVLSRYLSAGVVEVRHYCVVISTLDRNAHCFSYAI